MKYTITTADFIKKNFQSELTRTAYQTTSSFGYHCKTWKTREAMAKAIRKQDKKPPHYTNYYAVIPLLDGEGY